ncbi:hypothetical protein [Pararhodobacter zhoushanensis]|uniref:hypothetical protein n=1 Tax=Pararhodobacter zhoushanensis TaxID=2479545 RepID=UPI000F8D212E|nr:hypothetical protein [Pararhodobacter zhoushanensis]
MNAFSKAAVAGLFALIAPAAASAACPTYAQHGAPLSYTAETVWTPQSTTVIAGGDQDLSTCAEVPGAGYVIENPDFTLTYDALNMGRALEFRVTGSCDTVLLVNSATGEWLFNDDTNEMHPVVRLNNAPSGQYDLWVGTYGPETCEATLTVESF